MLKAHGLTHTSLAVVEDPDGYEIEIWYE